jgi:ELWxxDGT repeat protein
MRLAACRGRPVSNLVSSDVSLWRWTMRSPRDLLVAVVCLWMACSGSNNSTPGGGGGGGPQRVSIELAVAAAGATKLASAEQDLAGNTMFFVAREPATGEELWKTDGTPGGTVLVKDLLAGTGSFGPNYLTELGDRVFFSCFNPGGSRLCVSDGTADGTGPLVPGPDPSLTAFLAPVPGGLVFEGSDDSVGAEPWFTDGTAEGTVRLRDIEPGPGFSGPERFTARGGLVFFSARPAATGNELWVTDGTVLERSS